jgi:hypothetical protein
MNNYIKISLALALLFSVYFFVTPVRQTVDSIIFQPSFQQSVVGPTVGALNMVLPDKLQITETDVLGTDSTSEVPSFSVMSEEVVKQASHLAEEQIQTLKTTATQAFCQAMIEKIQKDCGLTVTE